jgi:hypothetical protein
MRASSAKSALRPLLFLACFAVGWLGLAARVADAQPRHTAIALVSGGADAELHARLRAELAGLGWRVKELGLGGDLALAQVARRAGTLAVLRVGRSAEGIEVWVAPEVDSDARSEWIDVDARRPELAVLRAVEALRARFLELGIEPEDLRGEASGSEATPSGSAAPGPATAGGKPGADARPAEAKPPPKAPDDKPGELGSDDHEPPSVQLPEVPHAPETLWLSARGGVISASKQLAPTASVSGAVRFVHESWLGVDLSAWWSPVAARVTGYEGYADVRAGLVALGGEVRDRRGSWTLAAGGGAALVWLSIKGYSVTASYRGQSAAALTGMPYGRVAAELTLVRRLHLRAEGMLGLTVQRAHVLFDQTSVATWGRPLLAGTLGLEWAALGD